MSAAGPTRVPPPPTGITGLLVVLFVAAIVQVVGAPADRGLVDVPDAGPSAPPSGSPFSPSRSPLATPSAEALPSAIAAVPESSPAAPVPASPAPTAPGATPRIASGPTHRVATRVTVPALGIDLPVMRQVTAYPPCRVAMYVTSFRQPGQGGVTYLYAHAQAGMFLPLLRSSLVNNGQAMLGMEVFVYTGDSKRFTYRISEVRRHVTTYTGAQRWRGESVFLQTSEGRGIPQKLQVVAPFVAMEATDFASAHPLPRPATC